MAKKKIAGIFIAMVSAFFFYFASEAVLRQAVVAHLNPKKYNTETVISLMPASLRDSLNYKFTLTALRNAVAAAKTPREKVSSMASLAMFTKDASEADRLYANILKMSPSLIESQKAYINFLLRDRNASSAAKSKNAMPSVSLRQLQDYMKPFTQEQRFNIWADAVNRINAMKPPLPDSEILDFLMPILSEKAEFRDYSILYAEISKIARRNGKTDIERKADDLADEARFCVSIIEHLSKISEEEYKKAVQAEKDKSQAKK